MQNCLAIDPGLEGTGYACWIDGKLVEADSIYSSKEEFTAKSKDIAVKLRRRVGRIFGHRGFNIAVEFPTNWTGSRKGYAATASGALLKLSYLIGVLATKINGVPEAVPVAKYKGTLPKDIVANRARHCLGLDVRKVHSRASHTWDAVYLGLWYQGLLKP